MYPLPALPDAWKEGAYQGLVARGNISVSARWKEKRLTVLEVTARVGGTVRLCYPGIEAMKCEQTDGTKTAKKEYVVLETGRVILEMETGETVRFMRK